MSEQKLRIGIIGIGWYAATVLIPTLQATGRAELVAIARRRADRLALAQQELHISEAYTDWREMLDKSALDAVVICTPPNAHTEPTVAALERGLHVFVEKPMALTCEDAHRMVTAAAQAERILMVGYNARGMGSWRTIQQLLTQGGHRAADQRGGLCRRACLLADNGSTRRAPADIGRFCLLRCHWQ